MGEAGPEAIMPLTRSADGSLGVRVTGAQTAPAGSGEIHITQHINVSGNGDAALKSGNAGGCAQGAADGAKKARQDMLSDFQTNGQARRMLGV
jgi:phage-related minor tail protein